MRALRNPTPTRGRLGWLALATLLLTAISLRFLPVPFVCIGFLWTCCFGASALLLPRPWTPYPFFLFFNAGVLVACLTGAEVWARIVEQPRLFYSDGYATVDDVLGMAPIKGALGRSIGSYYGEPIYSVTYTIDSDGLRISPPVNDQAPIGCILFFGDSFTFGEGLQDTETLPYQVGVRSGGRYRVYNFAFHGYGPHQMLAAIERGVVRRVIKCRPEIAVYSALADHAYRIAGKVPFAWHGPRYRLMPDNVVRFDGHFDDETTPLKESIRSELGKSALFRQFVINRRAPLSTQDSDLMLAAVRRSRELLSADYPGIQFHIIFWNVMPEEQVVYDQLSRGFANLGFPLHRVSDILPNYTVAPRSLEYVLSPHDLHPNAFANRLLADYVLRAIATHADQ